MPDAEVHLGDGRAPLRVRINGPDATFRLASEAIRTSALADLDARSLDLLEIAATVFAADSGTGRGGDTRPNMGRDWRRNFAFRIPVRRPELWSRSDITGALVETTEFLTEDRVSFDFVEAEADTPIEPYFVFDSKETAFRADEVILFSGGLDSFAGALEALSAGDTSVVLVTHRSSQKAISRQVLLGNYLKQRFPDRVLQLHVNARRANELAADATQRSRTLLFAAMGQAVAHAFGAERLSFYENGVVSHNLPLSQQIVGTMATRTTHPLALRMLNRLLGLVWPEGARIDNRYRWLTKTDVVRRVAENGGKELIPKAVSCTSVRDQTRRHTHCGACSQCLDRRFAILAAGLDAYDAAEDYRTDVLFGARETTRSRTMALEWTRHALRLGELDGASAMSEYGLELGRIISGHPEQSSGAVLQRTLEMHHRHSEAVRTVLERMISGHTAEIATQTLPSTSLLVMHVGQTSPREALATQASSGLRFTSLPDEPITEPANLGASETEAGACLRVAFFKDGERFVVAAAGLGRVVGKPAMIAHGLKPAFDADRAEGRAPEDHRYIAARDVPYCEKTRKSTFRKLVSRCRRDLAEFYEEIHGAPPETHLLIENVQGKGYRLDPRMKPIDRRRLDSEA